MEPFSLVSVGVTEGGTHLMLFAALAALLVPSDIDVSIGDSVEHFLVLDVLRYALLH